MLETAPPLPASAEAARPAAWSELIAYLVVGAGGLLVTTFAAAYAIHQFSLLLSVTAYALNVLCLGGTAWLLGVVRHKWTWAEFGLRPAHWTWLAVALLATLGLLPLRLVVAGLVQNAFGGAQGLQTRLDLFAPDGFSWLDFGVTLLGVGVLVPIAEEFYFRGLIHRWCMTRFTFWPRVLLSSFIFGLGHIDSVGVVAASFIMGIVLAALFERSQSLWVPIGVHIINNSLVVLLLYGLLALNQLFPSLHLM
jgi:hypothetical protein